MAPDHAVRAHADISASGFALIELCPGSLSASRGLPDTAGAAALRGTDTHELGELEMTRLLQGKHVVFPEGRWDPEQYEIVARYRNHVRQIIADYGDGSDPIAMIEQRVTYHEDLGIPEGTGFGTADLILFWPSTGTLVVVDLKTGRKVVSAQDNPQGKLYATGAVHEVEFLGEVSRVVIAISQGAVDHYDVWEASPDEIRAWISGRAAEAAQNALSSSPRFNPGDHCTELFCKARGCCKARAEYLKKPFDNRRDTIPGLLTVQEIEALLPQLKQIADWANNVLEFASEQAIRYGQKYKGFKVVAGKSSRYWPDENAVASALKEAGCSEDDIFVTSKKLIGIGATEKLVGKDHAVLKLAARKEGAPALVPDKDPRPSRDAAIDANFEE